MDKESSRGAAGAEAVGNEEWGVKPWKQQAHAMLPKAVPQRSMEGLCGCWQRKQGEDRALLFSIIEERNDRRWSSGEKTSDKVEERTGLPSQCP